MPPISVAACGLMCLATPGLHARVGLGQGLEAGLYLSRGDKAMNCSTMKGWSTSTSRYGSRSGSWSGFKTEQGE
jgi:hypothetical protein